MSIKTDKQITLLREGGKRLATILDQVIAAVKPGVTPLELDQLARELIKVGGDKPSFLGYQPDGAPKPYPTALCTSVNNAVVHGIPDDRPLQEGDIIGVDLGIIHAGLFTDMAKTVAVGKITPELKKLLTHTEQALQAGIKKVRTGNTIGDIGAAVSAVAKKHKYGVVRELAGHGVGLAVHEEPKIPNYGKAGTGVKLQAGMVIAIEPMFNLGTAEVIFMDDGFTVLTADAKPAAHFEHTVLVTEKGSEVLTVI